MRMVAEMSGRGLGHSDGTLDKLESIAGFQVERTREQFLAQVAEIGLAVIGQTGNLTLADKKLYALRDVTATVEAVPLIASSIMSKKIASGAARSGWIAAIDAERIGHASVMFGAERLTKDAPIDLAVGIVLTKKAGEQLDAGKVVAIIHANDNQLLQKRDCRG